MRCIVCKKEMKNTLGGNYDGTYIEWFMVEDE